MRPASSPEHFAGYAAVKAVKIDIGIADTQTLIQKLST
jgi:hypothetical protein